MVRYHYIDVVDVCEVKHVRKVLQSIIVGSNQSNTLELLYSYCKNFTVCRLWFTDPECGDVPLLTPGSKEMMSQALKATFSGFTKEQQRLGIPKGKKCNCWCLKLLFWVRSTSSKSSVHHIIVLVESALLSDSFTARREASTPLAALNTFGSRHTDWLNDWPTDRLQHFRNVDS